MTFLEDTLFESVKRNQSRARHLWGCVIDGLLEYEDIREEYEAVMETLQETKERWNIKVVASGPATWSVFRDNQEIGSFVA